MKCGHPFNDNNFHNLKRSKGDVLKIDLEQRRRHGKRVLSASELKST